MFAEAAIVGLFAGAVYEFVLQWTERLCSMRSSTFLKTAGHISHFSIVSGIECGLLIAFGTSTFGAYTGFYTGIFAVMILSDLFLK